MPKGVDKGSHFTPLLECSFSPANTPTPALWPTHIAVNDCLNTISDNHVKCRQLHQLYAHIVKYFTVNFKVLLFVLVILNTFLSSLVFGIMMTSSNGNISALLVLWAGNSPVTGEFPSQRPVTRNFDVFFDPRLNKRLSKQSRGWWLETPSCSLWRHCDVMQVVRLEGKEAPAILLA